MYIFDLVEILKYDDFMYNVFPIIILIGLLSSIWYIPFNLARDWWLLNDFSLEMQIIAQTWPRLLVEWTIRASGYSLAFGLFYLFKRQDPLFMSMVTVALTMVGWPIGLFLCLWLGWNNHLIVVVEQAETGWAGYGFAYIAEFALIITVQLTGWKLMTLFGLANRERDNQSG